VNGSRFSEQARQLLEESLDQLNALRNANTRDPGFKQWRQNALTLIQRLCPGDSARSDRFRRVPFSPPSSKADVRTAREWYERGCAEASQLMKSLLTEIEEHGVPQSMGPAPVAAEDPETMEGDFPTVSLPGEEPAPPRAAVAPPREKPAEPRGGARSARPEPPAKRSTPPPNLEDTLREVTGGEEAPRRPAAPRPAPKPARGSASRSVRERLKDMLGLGDMMQSKARDAAEHEPAPEPEPPAPRHAHREPPPSKPRPEPPAAAKPRPQEPVAPTGDERPGDEEEDEFIELGSDDEAVEVVELPEFRFPDDDEDPAEHVYEIEDEPTDATIDDAIEDEDPFAHEDEPVAEVPEVRPEYAEEREEAAEVEDASLDDQLPAWMRGQAAEPRRSSERTAARREEDDDASRRARARREERLDAGEVTPLPAPEGARKGDPVRSAMADVASRSPVTGARPRGGERDSARAAAGPRALTSPTAIALASIAAQVDELGVPEGHRARTRAALLELARQLEARELSWDVLREAVVFLVDYPPLARRVLPLLVPHLDQAA
jgi:hypothetical protein